MTSKSLLRWVAAISCISLAVGCTEPSQKTEPAEPVARHSQAFTSDNGFWANSLTTNALWQNGFWANGFWANSLAENGFWANGFWANGFWANGLDGNGFWANGFWANGFWANGEAANALKQSQHTRQLLQYIYECAMPAATPGANYDTFLDPGVACNPDGTCAAGYTCRASDSHCIVPLQGSVGIGINTREDLDEDGDVDTDDHKGWWEVGECHESCQRWVSACVLARTNAYGVRVELSMGAPATAPQRIKDALGDPYPERDAASGGEYVLQEGEFYGNLFATTPGQLGPGGTFEEVISGVEGETSEVFQMTPTFNACAGPASNIPDMTKRFCSSQGDQTVIDVPGTCTEVCGVDPADSIYRCSDADGVAYEEVITVYLKQPIATCGNSVCENRVQSIEGGSIIDGTEDEASCPSDCPSGTWAIDYAPEFGFGVSVLGSLEPAVRWLGRAMSAVSPVDDTIVVVGKTTEDVDLGLGVSPAEHGLGVLAKYSPDGTLLWTTRVDSWDSPYEFPDGSPYCEVTSGNECSGAFFFDVNAVTVVPKTGNIVVTGYSFILGGSGYDLGLFAITFDADGNRLAPGVSPVHLPLIANQGEPLAPDVLTSTRLLAADPDGDLVIVGLHFRTVPASPFILTVDNEIDGPGDEIEGGKYFMVKLDNSDPSLTDVEWAVTLPGASKSLDETAGPISYPLSLATDAAEDVLLITEDRELDASAPNAGDRLSGGYLRKFSGHSGEELWSVGGGAPVFTVVATDASNDVYTSGFVESGADFGDGVPVSVTGRVPFLAKYSSSGIFQWVEVADTICPFYDASCSSMGADQKVQGMAIKLDAEGNVVLGSYGNPMQGGGIDFSPGTPDYFPTYQYENLFVSAYNPALAQGQRLVWAKQIPTILGSSLLNMDLTSESHVVVSGNYSGSMQANGQVLVSDVPQDPKASPAFLSSFGLPSPTDDEPPRIGVLEESPDASVLTVPADIHAQATGRTGAVVFFMPPTAIDTGHAGVSVTCVPQPNSLFPIDDTEVTCTAADARGNIGEESTSTFTVHVVDTIGPIFTGIRAVRAPATSPHGAVVQYSPPVATDQVDGTRPVTCTPESGKKFGFGTTEVTCTSSDTRDNTSIVTFPVRVPYVWSGFLPPINAHGCSVFKRGSTVPVKFKLTGFSANIKDLVAKLMIRKIGSEEWLEAPPTSGTGNVFRYDAKEKQYIFNLSTKHLAKGKWELLVDMGDGESRTVKIQLR